MGYPLQIPALPDPTGPPPPVFSGWFHPRTFTLCFAQTIALRDTPPSFAKRLTGGYIKILRSSVNVRLSVSRVFAEEQRFRPICPKTASIGRSRGSDLGLDGKNDYDEGL